MSNKKLSQAGSVLLKYKVILRGRFTEQNLILGSLYEIYLILYNSGLSSCLLSLEPEADEYIVSIGHVNGIGDIVFDQHGELTRCPDHLKDRVIYSSAHQSEYFRVSEIIASQWAYKLAQNCNCI